MTAEMTAALSSGGIFFMVIDSHKVDWIVPAMLMVVSVTASIFLFALKPSGVLFTEK